MKRRCFPRLTWLCLRAAAAGLIGACGSRADTAARAATPDALDYALDFARRIPADESFESDKGRALTEVVQAAIRRGELDRAVAIAPEIKTWQRGQAYAELAREKALAGKTREAWTLVAKAEVWEEYIRAKCQDGTMGWQADRISIYVAAARAALGDTNATGRVFSDSQAQVAPEITGRIVQADTNSTGALSFEALDSGLPTNRQFLVQNGVLKGLLAWAENRQGLTSNELERVLARVDDTLSGQPVTARIPLQYRVAALLRTHGRATDAEARVGSVERAIRALPRGVPMSLALGEAAVYAMRFDASNGLKKLDEAVAALSATNAPSTRPPESPPPPAAEAKHPGRTPMLKMMAETIASDRTPAYCALAEMAVRGGHPERAAALYEAAFREAAKQVNPVPRRVRFTDVCARMAASGTPLTPAFRMTLERRVDAERTIP